MDFRRLSRAIPKDYTSGNGSEPPSFADLSPNILDSLIPGYSFISRYTQAVLGIDISLFVSVVVISLAVIKFGQYFSRQVESAIRYLFVSSVYIDEHDDLFDMMMAWVAKTQTSMARRSVLAKTQRGQKAQAEMDENYDALEDDALNENGMFDFNKWSARMPPRYEPYYGRHFLRHNGHWFLVRRSQRASDRMSIQWGNQAQSDDDLLQIDCLGRSIAPIESLLRTVKVWSLARMRHTTTIRHPTPKDRARWGGAWSKTSSRPSRPMDTVILDNEQKRMVINDMNEFLHPSSPKWYATRGIPYRRGYLFFGPPGTGKTSLSFALAGIFGLEIYAISLQEPTLTEGDLMQLFNGLPRRCIVLLEDVDAAGLIRDGKSDKPNSKGDQRDNKVRNRKGDKDKPGDSSDQKNDSEKSEEDKTSKKPEKDEEYTLRDLARELKSINSSSRGDGGRGGSSVGRGHSNVQPGAGISLSGLLNAIDGVATHEGRVLIMTTNHPEQLDSALVRPGRVDRRIEFGLAMKEQIRELFIRMYAATAETDMIKSLSTNSVLMNSNGAVKEKSHANGNHANKSPGMLDSSDGDISTSLSPGELEELAIEFAADIPDATFTPAEIQNHLMRYKKEPHVAVEKSKAWMEETMEEKEIQRLAKEDEESESSDDENSRPDPAPSGDSTGYSGKRGLTSLRDRALRFPQSR